MPDLSHTRSDIAGHPDVAEMRERYARVAGARQAVALGGLILLTGLYTAISPWVVALPRVCVLPDITVNNLVVVLTIAVIGLGMTLAGDSG
jgi:hypothetical protein